jgi:cysteine-rich repeat protein
MGIESQQVIDYGTYNSLSDTDMKKLMENFIQNYVNYDQDKKNVYFIFGNKDAVNVIGYQELNDEAVCIKLNPAISSPKCGDGVVNQPSEECDDGNTKSYDGCSSKCKMENPTKTSKCGNSKIDSGEYCDGTNLNGKTCTSLGFDSGSGQLKCPKCKFDVGSCVLKTDAGCIPLKMKETQTFSATGGVSTVVIRIETTEYQFKLKGGENFYFVIWQNIGGEKHVVTS